MLGLVLILVILFPIAWLASEFHANRTLRIVLGICAISMSYLVAWGVGYIDRFHANIWYGTASKELVEKTITELENGNTERILIELRALNDDLYPTYQSRANYDKLVATYVDAFSKPSAIEPSQKPQEIEEAPE